MGLQAAVSKDRELISRFYDLSGWNVTFRVMKNNIVLWKCESMPQIKYLRVYHNHQSQLTYLLKKSQLDYKIQNILTYVGHSLLNAF